MFGSTWCFYRKLYGLGVVYLVAGIVAGVVGLLVSSPESSFSATMVPLASIFLLARLPLSLFTDAWYYRKAVKIIGKYDNDTGLGEADRAFMIENAGGTSIGGLLLALLVSVALRVLVAALPKPPPVYTYPSMRQTSTDLVLFVQKAQRELPLRDSCAADVMPVKLMPDRQVDPDDEYCPNNEEFCLRQCVGGNVRACYNLARDVEDLPQAEAGNVAKALFLESCKLGSMSGCTNYAAHLENSDGSAKAVQCAVRTYEKTCAFQDPWGCTMYARGLLLNDTQGANQAKVRATLERACQLTEREDPVCIQAQELLQSLAAKLQASDKAQQ